MVTKIDDSQCPNEDVGLGDNRMKDEWFRGGGMNIPRMRRPEEQLTSNNTGLMMEVWASVASWFLKPDGANPLSLAPCFSVASMMNNNSSPSHNNNSTRNNNNNNCRISNDLHHLPLVPTICAPIRCTVPGCNCECFTPGKLHIRYCEACSHGWVPHALDKLGFRHIFSQNPVEPVQPNVAFDIASLVLYGCQALPIRLKILLDRLFSVLQKDEVTQILRGFGWNHEDYARGYILQESHGVVLDRWNICSPEEEPLVLQQFLRFGETRAITQQLLLHGLGDMRQLPPRMEADFKKMLEKNLSLPKNFPQKLDEIPKYKHHHHHHQNSQHKSRASMSPPTNHNSSSQQSLAPIQQMTSKFSLPSVPLPPSTYPTASHPTAISPQQKPQHQPINFLKLPQTGLTCTPVTSSSSSSNGPRLLASPPRTSAPSNHFNSGAPSPLNKLQNMQPFDFRKIASSALSSSKSSPERRRFSDHLETSQTGLNLCVTSPSNLLPPPPPPVIVPQMITPNFPHSLKSPSIEFTNSMTGSSEFGGSEDGDDEDETHQNVLNLSKDATANAARSTNNHKSSSSSSSKQRHTHSRKASTPMKRQWGSSNLPLNLGTQLINPATGKKRVQCNVCLKTFCDKGALKIHFSAVHLREMHKCTVEGCNMMFSSRRSRNRHSANPNPKLHSPHLRRKISPHDGRSAQSHPLLIPPLQAGLGPLPFGPFPILTAHDLRHHQQMPNLAMKHHLDFGSENSRMFDTDEYMDEDEEEGIVVDGGGVDDDENYSESNSKEDEKKMTDSDDMEEEDDGISNIDTNSNEGSDTQISITDTHVSKEEKTNNNNVVHKRKSQNPTRRTTTVVTDDEAILSDDDDDDEDDDDNDTYEDHSAENNFEKNLINFSGRELDLSKRRKLETKSDEDIEDGFRKYRECENNNIEIKKEPEQQLYEEEECLNLSKDSRFADNIKQEFRKLSSDNSKEIEEKNDDKKPIFGFNQPDKKEMDVEKSSPNHEASNKNDDEDEERDVTISPTKSNDSYNGSCGSCESGEVGHHRVYGHFENDGTFVENDSEEVPLDKDNPRKCAACGKMFPNSFGVKNHYQNVHLKLMHKCVIDGCNAAFPSKRSRDRHSSNLNLHRKLLSTTSDSTMPPISCPPPFPTNEFFSRIYSSEGQISSFPGDDFNLQQQHHQMLIPPFPNFGLNPFMPSPLINGSGGNSRSPPVSPARSPPKQLVYNIEEDMPTAAAMTAGADQDNPIYHCRFCSKPFERINYLKDHYEKHHLNEMFRCKVPGCLQVFSSRTKRNHHSENKIIHQHHAKELSNS